MARLENLLGAQSLAVADRLLAGAGSAVGPGPGTAGPGRPGPGAHGPSSSECSALVTLLAHPGRTLGWLGEVLGLTSSGVTRLVDRLVTAGWVARSAGTDARQRQLVLTADGAARAQRMLDARENELARVLGALSEPERASLESLLDKIVAGLADDRRTALQVCRLCDREACCLGRDCPLEHTVPVDE
jgi:DNA-binding MarR family transcriptional regulator